MTTMGTRGIRGAISVGVNSREAILAATRHLLQAMQEANQFQPDELASIFFTVTSDLDATFPAEAARQLGWHWVPLLTSVEVDVPGAPRGIIRILALWNTDRAPTNITHIYLGQAEQLRPDLARGNQIGGA